MSIKARDVRVNIAEVGFERGVVHSLEAAIEEINALRGNLRDAAELMQVMSDNLEGFLKISKGMQSKLSALERNTKEDDNE